MLNKNLEIDPPRPKKQKTSKIFKLGEDWLCKM